MGIPIVKKVCFDLDNEKKQNSAVDVDVDAGDDENHGQFGLQAHLHKHHYNQMNRKIFTDLMTLLTV